MPSLFSRIIMIQFLKVL
uniref:Uncharacterized protein n=1 Tax=Arundo donax TaxID=35708 RepID=A0A0A9E0Y4_ARUDO